MLLRPRQTLKSPRVGTSLDVEANPVALQDLMDRSPLELPVGVPVRIHIRGVEVVHPRTGEEVELSGAVDFAAWDECTFQLTSPETGSSIVVKGLCLLVDEVDGVRQERRANVVARRLITALRPYLESGEYVLLRFTVTKTAERPRSTFSIATEPLP